MPTTDGRGRVFVYARASTAHQEDSPEIQKGLAREYIERKKLGTIDAEFVDVATSGNTPMADRYSGQKLLEVLRKGDNVVIAKFDRAFRNLADAAATIDRFVRIGVQIHVVDSPLGDLDMGNPFVRYMFHNFAAFAELERSMIRKRIEDGIKFGKAIGRSVYSDPPLGYSEKVSEERNGRGGFRKYLVPNAKERDAMHRMYVLRQMGWTYYAIAKYLRERGISQRNGKPFTKPCAVHKYISSYEKVLAAEPEYAATAAQKALPELPVVNPHPDMRFKANRQARGRTNGSGGQDQDRIDLDIVEDDIDRQRDV